jgi:hypothetical protein
MAWNNTLGGILGVGGAAASASGVGLPIGIGLSGLGAILNMFGPSPEQQFKDMEGNAINTVNNLNMPGYDQILQTALGNVNTSFNKGQRDLVSYNAGSGLSKSGIGAASLNDLQAKRGQAVNQATSQVTAENLQWKQNVLAQLLGLGGQAIGQENQAQLGTGQGLGGILGTLLNAYMNKGSSLPGNSLSLMGGTDWSGMSGLNFNAKG